MPAATFQAAVSHLNQNPDHDDRFFEYAGIVLEGGFRYSVGKLSGRAISGLVSNSSRLSRFSGHPAFNSLIIGYLVPIITDTVIDLLKDHHDDRPIKTDQLLSHVVHNAYGSLQEQGIHHALESHFPGHGERGAVFAIITLDVLRHAADHA